jgi:uncharacterized protein (UPF0147 family)
MFELIKALIDQSKKKIEKIIKQFSAFASKQWYQLQCVILNHMIEKTFQLNIKTEEFWHYVKTNIESWDSHYQNERAFEEAFSILSNVINSIAKARNIYEKAFKKINALWDSTKKTFARNQFVQVLRNLRRCALRDMTLKEACRAVVFAIKNRLNNSTRNVSTSRESINRDWIKIINENYDFRQIKFIVIISSSFVVRLKEKKNRKIIFVVFFFSRILTLKEKKKNQRTIFVVFFFSMMLSSIEKKKNQRAISVDFSFDRVSSSSSLSSSSINFESRLVTQSSRSLSSSAFKDIAIMFDALMKNVVNFSKARLKRKYLTKQHHEILSSISFTSKSSLDAFRSRKRVRKMISITSKKRVKSSKNSCECAMSTRWREILTQVNRIRSIKSVEHLLKRLYYLKRQICERHINELERLYDLLSMKNLNEMKNILWRLLKYSRTMKIFKIENVDLYENFENDD